jgi:glutamyl-tRNA reductase
MKVQLLGCSHKTASIDLRERLAFSPDQAASALEGLRRRFPQAEAVLLSTCNRVELYTAVEDARQAPSHADLAGFLAGFHGVQFEQVFGELFQREGEDAVRHLFKVAASLDSMVVGEPQILSQVKEAYQLAAERESAGALTHAVFQAALKVARRVASETSINQKRVSIPSVAVEYARGLFEQLGDKRVLVIGAGEMGQETLRYLHDEGASQVTVINRSRERAEELAVRWNAACRPWEELAESLVEADVVISTTGAEQPIMTLEQFWPIESARSQRVALILDLAIPRDFDPAIGEHCPGIYLCSIDDLDGVCRRNLEARQKELPKALSIIDEETSKFMQGWYHRATGQLITRLKQGWQAHKEEELRRLYNKLPELDESSREEIARSVERLINKLLHPPLESLKEESRHGVPHALMEALRRLFNLRD